ncbi:rRNA maturation RNase YbeY [Azospirillum sp. RWY-5-1]|uniref:Endoribonuclease YbeY n=1 Tax=Azospirillum oleiclasticum TaxID=2735135 RepID=A0ABX2T7Q1_9PROT|nr:rRNA maturation RNase YbeY [Azospirillum oleiclasticum]NYZ12987.1 rRNA maturation RNase YbeY [Azospirillum oleiclasticum]NYZ20340.1 rRNA maturation RNase YbeY [Azospirillum oleiclasticum]
MIGDPPQPGPATTPAIAVDVIVTQEAGDWGGNAEWLAERAAIAALAAAYDDDGDAPAELSVVLADDAMVQTLNRDYRGKDKPTNVLSFALTEAAGPEPEPGAPILLGDVILARETVVREAAEQGKPEDDHLTHLVVHGVLHLLGYDHEQDDEAEAMERLETRVLAGLGIPDPYADPSVRPTTSVPPRQQGP